MMAQGTSNWQKYSTPNPLMRRIIERFVRRVCSHVQRLGPERVIDLGCGEGLVGQRLVGLPGHLSYRGLEVNPEAAAVARQLLPEAEILEGDLMSYPPEPGWADLALCLEVIEHLSDPLPAVQRIATWTRAWALVSVPWEPYFRIGNFCRGKYLAHWGNHPEHVQQFTPGSLARLLDRVFVDVQVETCFPWLIAKCRKASA